jgi:hypothetical protein
MSQAAHMGDARLLAQGLIADITVGLDITGKVLEKVQGTATAGGMIFVIYSGPIR